MPTGLMDSPGGEFKTGLAARLEQVEVFANQEISRLQAIVADLQDENSKLAHLLQQANSEKGIDELHPRGDNASYEAKDAPVQPKMHVDGHDSEKAAAALAFKDVQEFGRRQSADSQRRLPSTMSKEWLDDGPHWASSEFENVAQYIPKSQKTDAYHTTGCAQKIVKSPWFENVCTLVITCNTIWIAIDLDNNDRTSVLNAAPIFLIMDNVFCIFFLTEILIRFAAYRRKCDCLSDSWFIFDSVVVSLMICEVWILKVLLLASGATSLPGLGSMSVMRMLRLLRLTRIARIIHAVPEIGVIAKGLLGCIRSVLITSFLLLCMTYVFAIIFKQLTLGTDIGSEFYGSVPESMMTLLVHGVAPDSESMVRDLMAESWYLALAFSIFLFLSALTLLNMLVGFLVDTVITTSTEEKDIAEVTRMTDKLRHTMDMLDTNSDGRVTISEAKELLRNTEAHKSLQRVGVDVHSLVQELDHLFDEAGLDFDHFVAVVLQFRASQPATVGVVGALRKSIRSGFRQLEARLANTEADIDQQFQKLRRIRGGVML